MEETPDMKVRMPADLRARIKTAAEDAGRSLNAEIRMRLEWSFEAGFDGQATDKMLENEVESLRAELRGAVHNLNETIKGLQARLSALEDH